jgi:hypothetical protein
MPGKGRPFTGKDDPRRSNNGGRPPEHPLKGKVAMEIWEATVKLMHMTKSAAVKYMSKNPTIIEIMAWKYINDYPTEAYDRFCGRIPNKSELTGKNGIDLIPGTPTTSISFNGCSPEQIDKFIENTGKI